MSQNELLMSPERRRFEHWFSDQGKWPQAVERSGNGYRLIQANDAWLAWQAACPEGWQCVPVEPTNEMVGAASEAYMPFGDMALAIQSAIVHAPKPGDV